MGSLAEMFGSGEGAGFLGLPEIQDLDALPSGTAAVVFGADTATPYPSVGAYCSGGAAAIRAGARDFAANRTHVNFDIGRPVALPDVHLLDGGDLTIDPARPADNRDAISGAVKSVVGQGAVPVLLGGDDSIPYPVLCALEDLERPIHVLQVDAHIDWRDEVQGERLGLSSPMRRASEMPHVAGIVQVGARGIGSARPTDLDDARRAGAKLFPMREVARSGIGPALQALPANEHVVLAFDWDVLDPAIMPAVIARTPGGMSYWDALDLIEHVARRCRLVAAVFAEFMPERDIDMQGARTAAGVVAATLGCIARARTDV